MRKFYTFGEIYKKIEHRCDLAKGDTVSKDEVRDYTNEAIDFIESKIHDLSIENLYFKKQVDIQVPSGQSVFSLPDNIYGLKIVSLLNKDESGFWSVVNPVSFNTNESFADYQNAIDYKAHQSGYSEHYEYDILKDDEGPQRSVVLIPGNTVDLKLRLQYIAESNRLENDDSVCDIPLGYLYLINRITRDVKLKQVDPQSDYYIDETEKLEKALIRVLSRRSRQPDQSLAQPDTSNHNYQMMSQQEYM